MVTNCEDEQGVEHVERPEPTRVEPLVREDRLQEDQQEDHHRKADDRPAHLCDDRGDQHQDRYEMQNEEAPLSVGLEAFATENAQAGEEELNRDGDNEQPGEPGEDLARHANAGFSILENVDRPRAES